MGSATYRAVSVPTLLSALNGIAGCGPSDTDYSLFSEYQSPDGKFTVSVETTHRKLAFGAETVRIYVSQLGGSGAQRVATTKNANDGGGMTR
jgi:hypothetical protein